jgi:hypothetical protein
MTMAWRVLEYLPKSDRYKEWPQRRSHFGFYIPDAEPRLIPDDAVIHESVEKRMNAGLGYQPVNFPRRYTTFPMSEPPSGPSAPDDDD